MPNTEASCGLEGKVVNVAVGVVENAHGEVLIACRQAGQHLAGLWEFPGGKIETGETPEQALLRELREEVGLSVIAPQPLFTIEHAYPAKQVCLVIMLVNRFSGTAEGKEGQQVRWVKKTTLRDYVFPEANAQIVDYILAR